MPGLRDRGSTNANFRYTPELASPIAKAPRRAAIYNSNWKRLLRNCDDIPTERVLVLHGKRYKEWELAEGDEIHALLLAGFYGGWTHCVTRHSARKNNKDLFWNKEKKLDTDRICNVHNATKMCSDGVVPDDEDMADYLMAGPSKRPAIVAKMIAKLAAANTSNAE